MQRKALLLDSEDIPVGITAEIRIFLSPEAISSYLEYDSFGGDEVAFLEDGERLDLIVKTGREYIDLLGRIKLLPDFKYIEAVPTGDFSQSGRLQELITSFLIQRGIPVNMQHKLADLIDILSNEIGFNR